MPSSTSLNPWIDMWTQPGPTIRWVVYSNPSYGIYSLAALYTLQNFFFYCNWWSVGLRPNSSSILLIGTLLSPVVGVIWLYFMGVIYALMGRLLGGSASASHLRAVIAWSSIPYALTLFMWLTLICLNVDSAFIQDGKGPSSIFVNFITLVAFIWSIVLLIQSLREVQQFSIGRSIGNALLAWAFSSLVYFALFFAFRYLFF